ncbi:MAG: xylose isomerase [Desulfurococcales archaeon ex4484_58]|nr:MAG: xylose isomerase [Desulfurococcales archaeon ex4484_58]
MKIYIGIPLWINNFQKKDPKTVVSELIDNNIEAVELSIDYPWPYKEYRLLKETLIELDRENIEVNIHAPWRDLPFATPYDIIGDAVTKVIISSIEPVLKLIKKQKTYIVIHPNTSQKINLFNNRSYTLFKLKNRVKELTSKLRNHDVIVLLENLNKGIASNLNDLLETIHDIGHTGLCLDIGHLASNYFREIAKTMYYESFYDYLNDVISMIKSTIGEAYTIHLHDVDREGRDHLVVGNGILDFKKIYHEINKLEPKYIIYETFRAKNKNLDLDQLITVFGAQRSWARIYLQ